jgi:homoserine O-acetyltransferase/O-succinyltransferase
MSDAGGQFVAGTLARHAGQAASPESSDDVRHAKPLHHAQSLAIAGPFALEQGQSLDSVEVVYETYGTLNATRTNAVLICHALSGDSHVARHDETDDPGWWDLCVGPGKPIDTNRYFVICSNVLGGCRGTTGPKSTCPRTGKPYGGDFPTITVGDMVNLQLRLVDQLGIDKLLAVAGASMGGHQVLDLATRFPDRVAGAAAIATSPRLTHQALAFDVVGRNAILRDPHYAHGQYYDHAQDPRVGLAVARMLAHITYLSPEAMDRKFNRPSPKRDLATEFETRFAVGSYLAYQGHRFVERFDANSYLVLSLAMDLFNLAPDTAGLQKVLGRSQCRWLMLSFSSDWLFPPRQSQEMVDALLAAGRPVTYCQIESRCGHDAFLLPDDFDRYGEILRAFLAGLLEPASAGTNYGTGQPHQPTSIFHGRRFDYDLIEKHIPTGASVLDLGCGGGVLLSRLRWRGHRLLVGIEIDELAILDCCRKGLDVIRADLNLGLASIPNDAFDCVVLSQTLQTVRHVETLVKEMLRVGRSAIVSFPNLAYAPLRRRLYVEGLAPREPGLEPYQWFNTPDIRFLSILDFEQFCQDRNIRVRQRVFLQSATGLSVTDDPNLNADTAIFVMER